MCSTSLKLRRVRWSIRPRDMLPPRNVILCTDTIVCPRLQESLALQFCTTRTCVCSTHHTWLPNANHNFLCTNQSAGPGLGSPTLKTFFLIFHLIFTNACSSRSQTICPPTSMTCCPKFPVFLSNIPKQNLSRFLNHDGRGPPKATGIENKEPWTGGRHTSRRPTDRIALKTRR